MRQLVNGCAHVSLPEGTDDGAPIIQELRRPLGNLTFSIYLALEQRLPLVDRCLLGLGGQVEGMDNFNPRFLTTVG